MPNTNYQSPLAVRYASKQMNRLFGAHHKFKTWRHIWVTLAETQKELGLAINQEQIDALKQHVDTVDFERARVYEQELRHDVMAHVYTYGDDAPVARPIIHLGATSCLITDNADIIIMREALCQIEQKLLMLIKALSTQAQIYKDVACLSFTHLQPGQPTTVGKRFCLWLQDFLFDLRDLRYRMQHIHALGAKGATGTQASFLHLFNGEHTKVQELDRRFCEKLGFDKVVKVSGQTYLRKQDAHILHLLGGIATSAHKMATDLRLLAFMKEIEEPFGTQQVGSSAMPYKRNPMRSERICSLARYVISLTENPIYTAATQWLERTLDDSANRRLCIPEAFLATDGVLDLCISIIQNMQIYPHMIHKNLQRELPFLSTETILMACTQKGADRQEMHERLRQHSLAASNDIKLEGKPNNIIQRIADDPEMPLNKQELKVLLAEHIMVGRAPQQVMTFLEQEVNPVLDMQVPFAHNEVSIHV